MSDTSVSAGARLRAAVDAERPLQVVGTINAYSALLAQRAGFRAVYLSGAGVANASFGLPDLGMTSLNDVCEDVRRITAACPLPLLVDADTGWGSAFNIAKTARDLIRAGADMIFAEALKTLDEYREFVTRVRVPVLANITEFGQTPLFTVEELGKAGVRLVLYPLSAFRAAAKATERVYGALRQQGTQKSVIDAMQTRAELYDVLGYHDYEKKLDELFGK